jgi:mycothiol synthase
MKIRPFDKEKDYPALVTFNNTLHSDSISTEEDARREDELRPSHLHFGDFIAEKDGKVVGTGFFGQSERRDYHPQKFGVWINVLPDYQRQGIGTALYDTLMMAIAPYNPIGLDVGAQEDWVSCVQFLQKMGFVEAWRNWESRLNVASFNQSVLQDAVERVATSGITIYTCVELASDPERDRKVYELHREICNDLPLRNQLSVPFDDFKAKYLQADNPNCLLDAWFIATREGHYVGLAALTKPSEGDYLYTHLTGVLPDYRGQGIASALKLRTVLYAKEQNVPEVVTTNAAVNKGIWAINEKMGFVKQRTWISFTKEIAPKSPPIIGG